MSYLIPYGEQFEKIVGIIESAKERAYRKVNEELILMYRDIGEYISVRSEKAEYGDAFVQKLASKPSNSWLSSRTESSSGTRPSKFNGKTS